MEMLNSEIGKIGFLLMSNSFLRRECQKPLLPAYEQVNVKTLFSGVRTSPRSPKGSCGTSAEKRVLTFHKAAPEVGA